MTIASKIADRDSRRAALTNSVIDQFIEVAKLYNDPALVLSVMVTDLETAALERLSARSQSRKMNALRCPMISAR